MQRSREQRSERGLLRSEWACLVACAALLPTSARASFLPPEMLDKAADIVALVVLCFVPIAVIVVFWLVHVLPDKTAEKRHHPQ